MQKAFERLLFVAAIIIAAGCYGGNAMIGIGQGVLVIAILLGFFQKSPAQGPRKGFAISVSTWFLVALILINLISILANLESYEKPLRDLKKLRHLILPLLVLILPNVRHFIQTHLRKVGSWVWLALLGSAILVTIADMVNLLTGFHFLAPVDGIERRIRLGGMFGMVMTYAYSMQFTILVIAGVTVAFWKRKIRTPNRAILVATVVALFVCGFGLFLSGSRGALLGCLVGGVVLIFLLRWKWLIIGFGVTFLVAIAASLALDNELLEIRPNESTRFSHWKTAAVTGIKNPVFGLGYRQFEKQCRDLKKSYGFPYDVTLKVPPDKEGGEPIEVRTWMHSNSHNNYLEAFASTGVFGMLALLGFLLCWLREVWKHPDTRLLFGPAIIGFLVAGIFENSFTDGEITALVMMFYVGSQFAIKMGSSPISEEQDV